MYGVSDNVTLCLCQLSSNQAVTLLVQQFFCNLTIKSAVEASFRDLVVRLFAIDVHSP